MKYTNNKTCTKLVSFTRLTAVFSCDYCHSCKKHNSSTAASVASV